MYPTKLALPQGSPEQLCSAGVVAGGGHNLAQATNENAKKEHATEHDDHCRDLQEDRVLVSMWLCTAGQQVLFLWQTAPSYETS